MKEYDVAIIGAGPAGSMLARLLQGKGLKIAIFDVRLLDRDYEKGDFIKSCGGLLAPDAQKFLKKQGISLDADVFAPTQSPWVKTVDLGTKITRFYKRNYLNLYRERFDRFLLKGIEADKSFGVKVKDIVEDDGFIINGNIKTKILVGADGASSIVRGKFFPKANFRKYISIQEVFEGNEAPSYECFFDQELTDYYGWRFTKDNGCVLGLAIPEGKMARNAFDLFKKKIGFGDPAAREGTIILRPKMFHPVLCRKNIFMIGEAGGYISPSSAEGFSFAFKTAKILADSNFDVAKFKRKMLSIQLSIFIKTIKAWFMYNPFLRLMVMCLSSRKNPAKDKNQA